MVELVPDWLAQLKEYYLRFSDGAVPYCFVMTLMERVYAVMKQQHLDGLSFKGRWPGDSRHVPPDIAVRYACDDAMNTMALYDRSFRVNW